MVPPRRVAIVGAGMVGLATAWYLQEYGAETVVFDQEDVASGSSWGNAGWLTPSLAAPLPEPAVLRFGLRAMLRPSSPVYVPLSPDLRRLQFLVRFGRNCTQVRWDRAMRAFAALNGQALDAFAELENPEAGVVTRRAEPVVAGYLDPRARAGLVEELERIETVGQAVDFELLSGDETRAIEPAFSDRIVAGLRIDGQRFVDPAGYVRALGEWVRRRGSVLRTNCRIASIETGRDGAIVADETFDAVVIATGARLNQLARPFGVTTLVQPGRGYSFTVPTDVMPKRPMYFPAQRVACTPVGDRVRLAGMMEFRSVDAPRDPRRIAAIMDAAAPLLRGADLDDRQDEWVGSRPCTTDGLPLIGRSLDARVFVAGGHGMWGMTLGPVTGKLLAAQIATGRTDAALRAVDPLRGTRSRSINADVR